MRSWNFAACLAVSLAWHISPAQVFADHSIPAVCATGKEIEVEVVIHKPATREFAQYEMTFQSGLAVKEVNSAGGSYRGGDNRIRIIWSISPQTPEIHLRFALLAGSEGTYTLSQKVEYAYHGERRVALLDDVVVAAKAGHEPDSTTAMVRINQVVPAQLPPTHLDSLENRLRDPAKAAKHVAQLRKDAREARRVGEAELKKAELELADAEKELGAAKKVTDAGTGKKRVAQAQARVQKAETSRQIAKKILVLATTLEENAGQIEAARLADSTARASGLADAGTDTAASVQPTASDTTYHVQLGAFSQHPGKSTYQGLGSVRIVSEDGLFKVIAGGFPDRAMAANFQRQLVAQGLEGFVVRYVGDRRVR